MWALWWLVAFVCRTEQHATGNKSFYEGNKKVVNVFVNLNTRLVPAVADNMARFAGDYYPNIDSWGMSRQKVWLASLNSNGYCNTKVPSVL